LHYSYVIKVGVAILLTIMMKDVKRDSSKHKENAGWILLKSAWEQLCRVEIYRLKNTAWVILRLSGAGEIDLMFVWITLLRI